MKTIIADWFICTLFLSLFVGNLYFGKYHEALSNFLVIIFAVRCIMFEINRREQKKLYDTVVNDFRNQVNDLMKNQ